MNDVSVVVRLPVRPIESGDEGDVEALEDKLVPVEEEQLPQGVADLAATMIWRQRPITGTGRGEALQTRVPVQGRDERASQAPRIQSALLDQSLHVHRVAVSQIDRGVMPMPKIDVPVSPSKERVTTPIEFVSLDPSSLPFEQVIPDHPIEPHPKTLPIAHGPGNAPSIALPVTAQAPASPPLPMLDLAQEEAAPPSRDFLQVPFNKGAANGQVTITRLSGEWVQNLVLSPSNPQVFEHLREPFEQARDAHWQLNEHREEQQHQGSRQTPDDEQEESQDAPQ